MPGARSPVQTGVGQEAPGESSQEIQGAKTFNIFFYTVKGRFTYVGKKFREEMSDEYIEK